MKTLTVLYDQEVLDETTEEELRLAPHAIDYFEGVNLAHKIVTTILHAVDEDGNHYRNLEFMVEARYKRDDDLWVVGAGFQYNVSEVSRKLVEQADAKAGAQP